MASRWDQMVPDGAMIGSDKATSCGEKMTCFHEYPNGFPYLKDLIQNLLSQNSHLD